MKSKTVVTPMIKLRVGIVDGPELKEEELHERLPKKKNNTAKKIEWPRVPRSWIACNPMPWC